MTDLQRHVSYDQLIESAHTRNTMVHPSHSDLEDVLQQVWVAGPGAASNR